MIAANYRKHLDAMQMQRELWSKSARDTILMRLAGLVFRDGSAPAWLTAAKRRARQLSATVQAACRDWIEEQHQADRPAPTNNYAAHVRAMQDELRRLAEHANTRRLRLVFGFAEPDQPVASSSRASLIRCAGSGTVAIN